MARKFVITEEGFFRLGDVELHKHLLEHADECIGGGFYQFDYQRNCISLSGASYDYGEPRWDKLAYNKTTVKIPEHLQGFAIKYRYADPLKGEYDVTAELATQYYKA